MTNVVMPQMGESIAEGTIVRWIKKVGDRIDRDEPLFEISTDKVDAEIPSPAAGILTEIKVKEGETVAVNSVVATIGSANEVKSEAGALPEAAAGQPEPAASTGAGFGASSEDAKGAAPPGAAEESREDLRRQKSSPLVRKIAAEHAVDISKIQGTGLSGRVTKEDILKFIESGAAPAAGPSTEPRASEPEAAKAEPQTAKPEPQSAKAEPQAAKPELQAASRETPPASARPAPPPSPAPGGPEFKPGERVQVVPMSVMRKKIAEHMVLSAHTSPHVYSVYEVNFGSVNALREKKKAAYEAAGAKLTFTAFIAKAAIDALRQFPIVNASIDGDNIVYKKDINLGIAVALDNGLIVPVIKNADEKNLLGLSRAINDVANRARTKKLNPDEVQAGTFTITNPGIFGALYGLPLINQPQAAILGVGAIEKRAVVIDDGIAIRPVCHITLGYDHRLVDGADAGRFLSFLKERLENFEEAWT
jgi:2-oxoglutarate dehydrogenase E2 component (dihydrolipoamide succinyltransferase)